MYALLVTIKDKICYRWSQAKPALAKKGHP